MSKLNSNSTSNTKLKDNQKLDIRFLCESIKEKLETNTYENMDAINFDLNQIKEACTEINNGPCCGSRQQQETAPVVKNLVPLVGNHPTTTNPVAPNPTVVLPCSHILQTQVNEFLVEKV